MALKGGFALGQPAGEVQEGGGMMAGEGERGVDEGVRLDEGTVEIDAERWKRSCVEYGGLDGQREILPWERDYRTKMHLSQQMYMQLEMARNLRGSANVIIIYSGVSKVPSLSLPK
jgi:hypothetical protein